ncbi:MAG: hypothetical protein HKN34_00915 [Gammaproteobacteria bacterium]|nr:hypothetical protein [Gammaproteobacteria bacterium]
MNKASRDPETESQSDFSALMAQAIDLHTHYFFSDKFDGVAGDTGPGSISVGYLPYYWLSVANCSPVEYYCIH